MTQVNSSGECFDCIAFCLYLVDLVTKNTITKIPRGVGLIAGLSEIRRELLGVRVLIYMLDALDCLS